MLKKDEKYMTFICLKRLKDTKIYRNNIKEYYNELLKSLENKQINRKKHRKRKMSNESEAKEKTKKIEKRNKKSKKLNFYSY